ncbi:hypothetical protein UlMin_010555 [Ulmus minor]
MHIAEREKLSYIRGKSPPPAESSEGYEKWYAENQKLTEIFRELDHRDKVVMKDPEDIKTYQRTVERLRVHIFLAGLDGQFEQKSEDYETSAMVARSQPKKNTDKSTSKCAHCHKKGHTKDRCFELVGYPDWWEHNRDSRKKNSKSTSLATAAENKPIEDPTETTSTQIATTSNVGKVLNTSTPEALADKRWKAAMDEEMKSLQKNETWELVDRPAGKKPNAFLHGELTEEVYMDPPPGYMPERHNQKVCRLKKALYGLKQSPRAWFGRFTKSMINFGYHQKERKTLQTHLSREFEMKDLGPLKYFLGIEVSRSKEGIIISQRKYALDLLQETGMSSCQPDDTPVEEGLKLCIESDQIIGDRLQDTLPFKKQNVVSRSSAESEYRGIALGLCEALWLRLLLQDLGYPPQQPIQLYCDNKAACDIAHNPVQHDRTKHVEVDRFFIKEKLEEKIVELPKIRSEDQPADILTKAVSNRVFTKFVDKLGMIDIYAPA